LRKRVDTDCHTRSQKRTHTRHEFDDDGLLFTADFAVWSLPASNEPSQQNAMPGSIWVHNRRKHMISTLLDLLGKFYANNDLTNFEAIARSIHAAVPGDPVSLQFIGLVYYRTGRVKEAISVFKKVMHRLKPAGKAARRTTDSTLSHGDSAAAACYREATSNRPELAKAWYDLGMALLDLREYEQAIPPFRSALLAQPEFPEAMLALGQTALRANNLAVAEEVYSRLQTLQPNNDLAYNGLGQVYRRRRDFATARACVVRVRLLRSGGSGIESLANRRRRSIAGRAENISG